MSEEKMSSAEWEIMRVVWTKGMTTSTEITEILAAKKAWKPSTIKTLLKRLVEKKMLAVQKEGKYYCYYPLIKETTQLDQALTELLSKVCARKTADIIKLILARRELSHDDIAELEKVLEERKKTAVNQIECDCLPGQCRCKEQFGKNE